MTAGKGIVHAERTPAAELSRTRKVFGIQSWVALPKKFEEVAPSFEYVLPQALPVITDHGREVRVIAGSLFMLLKVASRLQGKVLKRGGCWSLNPAMRSAF